MMKKLITGTLAMLLTSSVAFAFHDFIPHRIRFIGLHRIDRQTALSYLPVRPGRKLYSAQTDTIVNRLYHTGFFSNITVDRVDDDLMIHVVERPIISILKINGNRIIEKKDIYKALKSAGITEGDAFQPAKLNAARQAIIDKYHEKGLYSVRVEPVTKRLGPGRMELDIHIQEGHIATIRHISFVGNKHLNSLTLKNVMASTTWRPWVILTHSNRYSPAKLDIDMERIRMAYLDHGFLRFRVVRKEVHVTPDGRAVNITIYVSEGPQYRISAVKLAGHLMKQGHEIYPKITLKPGQIFDRQDVIKNNKRITDHYANQGFAFTQVDVQPKLNDKNHTADVVFVVKPGKRVYVHRIHFKGNTRTADYVMRREMQMMEGGPYTQENVNESKRRLMNLGYLEHIMIQPMRVPGTDDLVDLFFHVKDTSSMKANFRAGYSGSYGFLYGADINDANFMGTGKHVVLGFNNSEYSKTYSFSYTDPYFTPEGHSLGFNLFSERVTPGKVNLLSYTTDIYGGNIVYGIPVSKYSRLDLGVGYQHNEIKSGNAAPIEVINFINEHRRTFNIARLSASWRYSTYDRAIFPTKGFSQIASGEIGVPVFDHSLDYYKLNYTAGMYYPMGAGFILHAFGDVGYGDGYSNFNQLPFFKNFYAGGIGTVRGYRGNSLGPKSSCIGAGSACVVTPIGGNVLTTGSLEMIIPQHFNDHVRISVFGDAGNVFQDKVRFNQMRYSVGVAIRLYLPIIHQVQFSIAKTLNDRPGDRKKSFDFAFGSSL